MKKRLSDLFSISNNTIGYAQRVYLLDGAKGNSVKGEAISSKNVCLGAWNIQKVNTKFVKIVLC